MLLNRYQYSEIMIGTFIFAILYLIYRSFIQTSTYLYFDILYSTFAVFIILFLKHFAVNYYELNSISF